VGNALKFMEKGKISKVHISADKIHEGFNLKLMIMGLVSRKKIEKKYLPSLKDSIILNPTMVLESA